MKRAVVVYERCCGLDVHKQTDVLRDGFAWACLAMAAVAGVGSALALVRPRAEPAS